MKRLIVIGSVCFLLGTAAGWGMRAPKGKEEVKTAKAAVVTIDDNKRIVAGPDSKTTFTRSADGTERITIEGPVTIDTKVHIESDIKESTDRKTESCPPPPDYTVAGGAQWDYNGVVSYGGVVGRRLVGPVWGYCGIFAPPVRVAALVGVSF